VHRVRGVRRRVARVTSATSLAGLVCLVALAGLAGLAGACSACGRGNGTSSGSSGAATPSADPRANRVEPQGGPDAAASALRDVAMWTSARAGGPDELASLAAHEGASGLVEDAADPELFPTALRAMTYARGWAQLPFLTRVATGKSDDDARVALEVMADLATRPRRSEEPEDVDELKEGCEALVALAREGAGSKAARRERRTGALRALRMMPCPPADLPADLDTR